MAACGSSSNNNNNNSSSSRTTVDDLGDRLNHEVKSLCSHNNSSSNFTIT
jgi:hypothetical protein